MNYVTKTVAVGEGEPDTERHSGVGGGAGKGVAVLDSPVLRNRPGKVAEIKENTSRTRILNSYRTQSIISKQWNTSSISWRKLQPSNFWHCNIMVYPELGGGEA